MNRKAGFLKGHMKEAGQVIPMAAVMMVGLLGVAALAVDLGYLYVVRNELQNVSDAGALAGSSAQRAGLIIRKRRILLFIEN